MMDLTVVGIVLKSHGVKGHLVVRIDERFLSSFNKTHAVFFDINGSEVPFLIRDLSLMDEKIFRIKLQRLDDREEAVKLSGKDVWMANSDIETLPEKAAPTWVGYQIVTSNDRVLTISAIEEYPEQVMLVCDDGQGSEILIPLVEAWIEDVEAENQVIHMTLPAGLI